MNINYDESIIKYQKSILTRIKSIMNDQNITQQDLASQANINQSMISKLLSGSSVLTLNHIIKICMVLKISPSNLFAFDDEDLDELFEGERIYSDDLIPENDNLICNTSRPAFKGYLDTNYYIYFYSTMSFEENKILHGTLSFKKSDNSKRCEVSLELYTGKKDLDGKEFTKTYKGEMIISISLSTCYVILVNPVIGEMCFFSFRHMFLFNQEMLCRVAEVLTTSSGEHKYPTVHRMIISKYKLDTKEDKHFIRGQLRFNTSDLMIEKCAFEKLKEEEIVRNSPELIQFFEEINTQKELTYLKLEENLLRNIAISSHYKILGISILRQYAYSSRYNKIGSKPNEYIYKYTQSKAKDNGETDN